MLNNVLCFLLDEAGGCVDVDSRIVFCFVHLPVVGERQLWN